MKQLPAPRKLGRYFYTLDYPFDYGLDDLLEQGVHNIFELSRFVQKRFSTLCRPRFHRESGACTTFNFTDLAGNSMMARNFDYKDGPCILVRTNPTNGYKSIAVAAMNAMLYGFHKSEKNNKRLFLAPYACMDGINEKGLAIAVLQIKTKSTEQDDSGNAVVTTVAIRAVLDKCATVDEAVDFFRNHSMNDLLSRCYHYQITDASGKTVVVEYVDNELRVIEPEHYVHVENFFLSEGGDNSHKVGYTREKILDAAFEKSSGRMSLSDAFDLLRQCKFFYRGKRGYYIKTLWSAVYNCNECSMSLCIDADYEHVFKYSL